MPKLKTKKSLTKRIKVTKKKKVLRSKAGRRHLLSSKTRKRKRILRTKGQITKEEKKMIKQSLPGVA